MAFDSGSTLQQEDGVSVVALSSSSGGSGGGGGASTWNELSGKPSGLFASGGGSDGFAETQALAAQDIASALSHSPGLSGGIQTSIRASGSATDDALATEQAIREAVNAVGASSLADLSDVTLDSGTLYQDGYVLQGDGSGAYNDVPINEVLDSGNLGSLGSVSTTARDDGDVLQWVDGNLQYEHVSPSDLIAGSVGLDDLTDVTLNDTTKYEPQDVLAGNGNGQYVDKTIDTVLGEAEVQDLGNIANPSTDGNVIADQGGTYGVEAITSVTSGHVDWTDLQNVNHSDLKEPQVGYYKSSPNEWVNGFIADLIRERGALSVGDVSFAATWRTIESDTAPTQRPNGDPLKDGDVWIDTDASPVAEAYVWRNSQWNKTASAIGGNNIVTDSIDANKITADTITANEIKANTITANEIVADTITATQIAADTITAGEITADTITSTEIQADAITGDLIDATTSITVGNSAPNILVDGSKDPSRIESTNFASLTSGFRIQSDGFAEFGDIRARGAIRSAVFERDEQTLRGGTDIVTPSTVLVQDASAGDTTIEVESVPFSAGDDLRFKEGGTTEVRTISSISGTTITLNNGLSNGWTSGAAIARWNAERIVNTSDSQFAPFTSYVDDTGTERVRVGRIGGITGFDSDAYGIDIDSKLTYSSVSEVLEVRGTVVTDAGEIGPYSINPQGIASDRVELFDSTQKLAFKDVNTSRTGIVSDHDFNADNGNWSLSDFVFDTGNSEVECTSEDGAISQDVDLSSVQGQIIQVEIVGSSAAGERLRLVINNNTTGAETFSGVKEIPANGGYTRTFNVEIPTGTDVTDMTLDLFVIYNVTSQSNVIQRVQILGKATLTELGASGLDVFDDTGANTLTIDRLTGAIDTSGDITSDGDITSQRTGAEKSSGTGGTFIKPGTAQSTSDDTSFIDIDVLSSDANGNRDAPPAPQSGKLRLFASDDSDSQGIRLSIIFPNGDKRIIDQSTDISFN